MKKILLVLFACILFSNLIPNAFGETPLWDQNIIEDDLDLNEEVNQLKTHPYYNEMNFTAKQGSKMTYANGYLYYANKKDGNILYRTNQDGTVHEKIRPDHLFVDMDYKYWFIDDRIYFYVHEPVDEKIFRTVIYSMDLEGKNPVELYRLYRKISTNHFINIYNYDDVFMIKENSKTFSCIDKNGDSIMKLEGNFNILLETRYGLIIKENDKVSYLDGTLNIRVIEVGDIEELETIEDRGYAYIQVNGIIKVHDLKNMTNKTLGSIGNLIFVSETDHTGRIKLVTRERNEENDSYAMVKSDDNMLFTAFGSDVNSVYNVKEKVYIPNAKKLYDYDITSGVLKIFFEHDIEVETSSQDNIWLDHTDLSGFYKYYDGKEYHTGILRNDETETVDSQFVYGEYSIEGGKIYIEKDLEDASKGVYYQMDGQETSTLLIPYGVTSNSKFNYPSIVKFAFEENGYLYLRYEYHIYRVKLDDLTVERLYDDSTFMKVFENSFLITRNGNHNYHPVEYYLKNELMIEIDKRTLKEKNIAFGGADMSIRSNSWYQNSISSIDGMFYFILKDGNIGVYDELKNTVVQLTQKFNCIDIIEGESKERLLFMSEDDNYNISYDIKTMEVKEEFALGCKEVMYANGKTSLAGEMLPTVLYYEIDLNGDQITFDEYQKKYQSFYDVKILDLDLNRSLMILRNAGLVSGSNGYALLDNSLTRAEAVTLIIKMIERTDGELSTENALEFKDVKATAWYYQYIQKASALGLTSGVGNNMFLPNGEVTDTEFAMMLGKVFLKDDQFKLPKIYDGMDWKDIAKDMANNYELIPTSKQLVNKKISRKETFLMLYQGYVFIEEKLAFLNDLN